MQEIKKGGRGGPVHDLGGFLSHFRTWEGYSNATDAICIATNNKSTSKGTVNGRTLTLLRCSRWLQHVALLLGKRSSSSFFFFINFPP